MMLHSILGRPMFELVDVVGLVAHLLDLFRRSCALSRRSFHFSRSLDLSPRWRQLKQV